MELYDLLLINIGAELGRRRTTKKSMQHHSSSASEPVSAFPYPVALKTAG